MRYLFVGVNLMGLLLMRFWDAITQFSLLGWLDKVANIAPVRGIPEELVVFIMIFPLLRPYLQQLVRFYRSVGPRS